MIKSGRLVALDIGGVCARLNFRPLMAAAKITNLAEIPPELLKMLYLQERGRIGDPEFLVALRGILHTEASDAELTALWNTLIGEPVEGVAELVKEYSCRGFDFVFFSNTCKMHMDYFLPRFEVSKLVKGGVFSYLVDCAKPEAAAYAAFEREWGVPAVYFDDTEANIAAGKAYGWHSVRVDSAPPMREVLSAL